MKVIRPLLHELSAGQLAEPFTDSRKDRLRAGRILNGQFRRIRGTPTKPCPKRLIVFLFVPDTDYKSSLAPSRYPLIARYRRHSGHLAFSRSLTLFVAHRSFPNTLTNSDSSLSLICLLTTLKVIRSSDQEKLKMVTARCWHSSAGWQNTAPPVAAQDRSWVRPTVPIGQGNRAAQELDVAGLRMAPRLRFSGATMK
ncbi:UNVERIFIED_ORG: hypothetical protein J2X79_004290 [Arthrobacter globiformis]|nr:hypothetical protein [Arthrobacter globiformis]